MKCLESSSLLATYPYTLCTLAISVAIALRLGAWFPSDSSPTTTETKESPMTHTRRYAHKQAKALKRRRLNAQERHVHQQRQAQRDLEALRQALDDLGLPDDL